MNIYDLVRRKVLNGEPLIGIEEDFLFSTVSRSVSRRDGKTNDSPEQQSSACLSLEEANKLIAMYVRKGYHVSPHNHATLFMCNDAQRLVSDYIRLWPLCSQAEHLLFEQDDDFALLDEYADLHVLSSQAEVKFFSLEGRLQQKRMYVKRTTLSGQARLFLLNRYDGDEFIRYELEQRRLFPENIQLAMMNVENWHEWVKRYTGYAPLSESAQMKLFHLPKPKKMVRLYESRHGLCAKAKQKAQKLGWL